MRIADGLLLAAAVLAAVPFVVLAVEALAALLPARKLRTPGDRPACVVLIPAHNEEAGIAATIANVREQLDLRDRILVVADNCTDGTAKAAADAGAEVTERSDPDRRGKGFALDHGLRSLENFPPGVVVV